ncbi:MAG: hypothetical protein U1E60_26565 [Reyranellaceae bacterium]
MRTINAIALAYDAAQDRILAVVNPGGLTSWSYWLTRRLVVQVLGRLPEALEKTSRVAQQAPVEYRGELAAFEREAAIASTAPAMTKTDNGVLKMNATTAELAVTVSLEDHRGSFRFVLIGERGGQAVGAMSRPDLQRIIHMLEREVAKADWIANATPAASPSEPASSDKPRRLIN